MRRREESERSRFRARVEGKEGVKEVGEGGFLVHSSRPPEAPRPRPEEDLSTPGVVDVFAEPEWVRNVFPFSKERASRIRPWRRRSWEEMKGAEWRSPVQRVMSTQSRAWFRRLRREERGERMRGSVCEAVRERGGWVLSLRWIVCCFVSMVLYSNH